MPVKLPSNIGAIHIHVILSWNGWLL